MATAPEASMDVGGQDNMDLILQLPMAAAFAILAVVSLLQVLLPRPLSKQVSAAVHWVSRNTVLATVLCTLAAGMAVAVAATAAQLRYLYLSNAAPMTTDGINVHSKGMSATMGLSATASRGQKLWTTLLLGLADIVLCINIWGHSREQQQQHAQATASNKAMRRQAEGLQKSLEGAAELSRNRGTAGEAAPAGAPSTAAAVGGANKKIE